MPKFLVRATRTVLLLRSALVEANTEQEAIKIFEAEGHGTGEWVDMYDTAFRADLEYKTTQCSAYAMKTRLELPSEPHIEIVYDPELEGNLRYLYVPLSMYQMVTSPYEALMLYGFDPSDLMECNPTEWCTKDGQPFPHDRQFQ